MALAVLSYCTFPGENISRKQKISPILILKYTYISIFCIVKYINCDKQHALLLHHSVGESWVWTGTNKHPTINDAIDKLEGHNIDCKLLLCKSVCADIMN